MVIRFFVRTAGLAMLTALSACSTNTGSALANAVSGKAYCVTASSTAFFKYGPQQGIGADKYLSKDTLLTVLRPAFGYYKVQLLNGEEGYVASEDVAVAPPTLIAAANPPASEPLPQRGTTTGEKFRLDSVDPRLLPPPEALPESSPAATP
jgi:hypothetical protein